MLFTLVYYSARGEIGDQRQQKADNSGLPSAADFLTLYIYIYILLDTIGTCMQNFMNIDRQKNQAFFNYSLRTLFSGHTVLRTTVTDFDVLKKRFVKPAVKVFEVGKAMSVSKYCQGIT